MQPDIKRSNVDSLRISAGTPAEDGLSITDTASARTSQPSPNERSPGGKPDYDELAEATRDAETATSGATPSNNAGQVGAPPEGSSLFSGGYDPAKYANLTIDPAVKELFQYIGRYKPEKRELPTELKPFIPDYIAAMGDVDEFLKPPRPDGAFEPLGLAVLDEPSVKQSDPAIMRKFLRAHLKGTAAVEDEDGGAPIAHDDEDRARKIDQWVADVDALHEKEIAGEVRPCHVRTRCARAPAGAIAHGACSRSCSNSVPPRTRWRRRAVQAKGQVPAI